MRVAPLTARPMPRRAASGHLPTAATRLGPAQRRTIRLSPTAPLHPPALAAGGSPGAPPHPCRPPGPDRRSAWMC